MIKLEEILEMWKKDSVIDDLNLDETSKNAAKLHAKYLEYVSVTKLLLKKRRAEREILKKDKWLWYMGKMPKEDMDARGWPYDPFNGLKIMKSDIDYYEKADPELQKIDATVLYLETTLETLIEIMETLKWRHQTIKNMIEWKNSQAVSEIIKVKKKNEVFVTIEAEPSICYELSDFFTFFVPGYKFMPAFKNKLWDGKIRLFDTRLKTLYGGLIEYLNEFAETRSCTLEYEDDAYYGRPDAQAFLEIEQIQQFAETLSLYAHGKAITPRDYQFEAIHHALTHYRAMLLSPTASGKSLIIYILIRWFLEENPDKKVLLVVPTTSLVEQMFADFKDYSTLDENWNNEAECHRIYSGKEKMNISSRVVITTWQSIYKMRPEWFSPYGMVIGDEAHNFKAKSLSSIMEKLRDAKYRIGTTGTLDGTQTHKLVLEGLFGPVKKVTTTKELMDSNALAQLSIDVLLLKYADEYCQQVKKLDYQGEIDFIVQHSPRNKFIRNLAIAQTGNTLILYNYVEKHGKPLYAAINEKLNELPRRTRRLFFVSGSVDTDERERIRAITEKEKDAIIVASMGTFSTGINIRNLHNIVFASPSKSQIRVLQSIGRGLRKSDDGRATKVFDIADDLHWKKNRNYTLDHAGERIKMYAAEKFNYKIFEVPL